MKSLAIVSAILAVALGYPLVKTWTFSELSTAFTKKNEPVLEPYIGEALNRMALAMLPDSNKTMNEFDAIILSPMGEMLWTYKELQNVIKHPTAAHDFLHHILFNNQTLRKKILRGKKHQRTVLIVPAIDISLWTLADVTEALKDPDTNPDLIPHLEKARDQLNTTVGSTKRIGMVTRIGLVRHSDGHKFVLQSSIPKSTRSYIYTKTIRVL